MYKSPDLLFPYIFYQKVANMTQILRPGVQSSKFLNIDLIQHRFPESLKGLNIPTTLLHNHSHCPPNHLLVYINNFSEAIYKSKKEAQKNYHPCSWYLENKEIIPYQFCDQKLNFDISLILENLVFFQMKGFQNYGTTVRPIRNANQFETENGHFYVPIDKLEQKTNYSETAMDGKSIDGCFFLCVGGSGGHWGKHW